MTCRNAQENSKLEFTFTLCEPGSAAGPKAADATISQFTNTST